MEDIEDVGFCGELSSARLRLSCKNTHLPQNVWVKVLLSLHEDCFSLMSVAHSDDEEAVELGLLLDPNALEIPELDMALDFDVQVEHLSHGVVGECSEFLNESKDGDEIALDGTLGDMTVSAVGESRPASAPLLEADEAIFDGKPMFLQEMPTLGAEEEATYSAPCTVSPAQRPQDESLDSKPAKKTKGCTKSSSPRISQNVPILPRYSEPSTPSVIYEPPKRGKGTGKKRGEYKKRYRESSTSCHSALKSRPSETFVQGKTDPVKPLFVEREVFVSLDPDPLLHASPTSGGTLTEESETFQEYKMQVSPQVLHDTEKR